MIREDYVSFETAKLLKEKGFNEWCYKCYGTAVYHKGVPISFDEECDLKSDGLGDEIEYVEGGHLYNFGCNNSEKQTNLWAAPTLWVAMKWLREVHKIHVEFVLNQDVQDEKAVIENHYHFNVSRLDRFANEGGNCKFYNSYEEACESAIKYCLENLI